MKLGNQVASLDLCKQLKKLGVKQGSLFYWVSFVDGALSPPQIKYCSSEKLKRELLEDGCPSAFTVAELGEKLPERIKQGEITYYLVIRKNGDFWDVAYEPGGRFTVPMIDLVSNSLNEKNLAIPLGELLIYLIENGLVKVEEL